MSAAIPTAPFPLEQTFLLHSNPTATKTIYLDFDGHLTQGTQWNTDFGLPTILTPAFDFDGDLLTFNAFEQEEIQLIWEFVSEDFRPFDVDVTTEFPGIEALRNTFATDGTDVEWGQRVVFGSDSTFDWFTPHDPDEREVSGVAYGSFAWDSDTPCFVFGGSGGGAGVISHEVGHTLGLAHDGQIRTYRDDTDPENPVFMDTYVEYYPGHGSGITSWGPIMGGGGGVLSQWSRSEYFNAANVNGEDLLPGLQDDLEIITTQNGFDYLPDDHGSDIATASSLILDADGTLYSADGSIERNTDVDYFSFTVEGFGELVSFDINPFYNGPNLDILATLLDSSGNVVATSNPLDNINATFSGLLLEPGTYYLTVDGTGRPITFVDPAVHPGPVTITDPPDDPKELQAMLTPDTSDWGYSDYGSLGYYEITGTRKQGLVVGVDFDVAGGTSPTNWARYSGGGATTTMTNLVTEVGEAVPYELTISTTGTTIESFASANPINPADLPDHALPLSGLDGYITGGGEILTFTWSNLDPSSVYQVYVFGHADMEARNVVSVVGGEWNGVTQSYNFTQMVAPDGLVVNSDQSPGGDAMPTLSLLVISTETGEITINVSNEAGHVSALAGMAIAPTKVGSIAGQKWNDAGVGPSHLGAGNGIKDPGEGGLEDWIIYLDLNNDGILNSTADLDYTQSSPDVPQAIPDQDLVGVKSDLFFAQVGEIIDVNVNLTIAHTFDADLNVYLISPSGTRVKLFSDVGGTANNFTNTTLDDEAATAINTAAAPFTGTFRPEANISAEELIQYPTAVTTLSAFDGEEANGIWRLEIADDAANDTGTLLSWSLTMKLAGVFLEPFNVTDAGGNYSFADVLPGEYHVREHVLEQQEEAGWEDSWSPPPVTVRSGQDVAGINFGNWIPISLPGSISGNVWNDLSGDGVKDAGEPGLPDWIVYIDTDNDGVRDTGSTSTLVSTDVPQDILDPPAPEAQSRISFDGLGKVAKVVVTLDITHSFVGDLDAFLISPSGTPVELFTGVGGQYNDFHTLTLDDNAAASIDTIDFDDLPYTGAWQPEGLLGDFIGEDATGNWTLVIRDTDGFDQGTLNSWSLTITVGELFTETDQNGDYVFENLPPGTYRIREELEPGWAQTYPASPPGNPWWEETIGGVDITGRNFGNEQSGLLGDFNEDDVVDSADYVVWRKAKDMGLADLANDLDAAGPVGSAEYSLWRAHLGESLSPGGGSGTAALVTTSSGGEEAAGAPLITASVTATIAADVEQVAKVSEQTSEQSPSPDTKEQFTSSPRAETAVAHAPDSLSDRSGHQKKVQRLDASLDSTSDVALLALFDLLGDDHSIQSNRGIDSEVDNTFEDTEDEAVEGIDSVFELLGAAMA